MELFKEQQPFPTFFNFVIKKSNKKVKKIRFLKNKENLFLVNESVY